MSNPQNQTVKVRASFTQEAYISVHDAFEALKAGLGFWDLQSIGIKDGKLVRAEDVSYHGSPVYEYTELSNNPKWLTLFKAVKCIEQYMDYADSPQWERHLKPEQEETQDGPSMTM